MMLEISGLGYEINNKYLLKDVNFSVKAGESAAVIGPNGSGKTTLIKLIDALIKPSCGSVFLDGKDVHSYKRRELAKLISYVPQNSGTGFDFTAEEFVTGGRYSYMGVTGRIGREDKKIIKTAMDDTDTYKLKDRPLWKMSGGERQRVFIAAALAQDAGIMLLDEPTVYLDPKACADINALLYELNKKKKITIITVTHDINYALLSGSTLLGIKNGRQLFYRSAQSAYEEKLFNALFDTDFIYTKGACEMPQILTGLKP